MSNLKKKKGFKSMRTRLYEDHNYAWDRLYEFMQPLVQLNQCHCSLLLLAVVLVLLMLGVRVIGQKWHKLKKNHPSSKYLLVPKLLWEYLLLQLHELVFLSDLNFVNPAVRSKSSCLGFTWKKINMEFGFQQILCSFFCLYVNCIVICEDFFFSFKLLLDAVKQDLLSVCVACKAVL